MENVFIFGDIHGCYETLMALVAKLPPNAKLIFVGDLIDRGPKSKQVVDFVMSNRHDCVAGNHEKMMIDVQSGAWDFSNWMRNGGDATFQSYEDQNGVFDKALCGQHIAWMETLPAFLEYKDVKNDKNEYLLVSHSFAGNVWPIRDRDPKTFTKQLLWGRPINLQPIEGIFQVHGHTPQNKGPRIKSFYANIDTGACFKSVPGTELTCLAFPSMQVYSQKNID